MVQAAVFFPTDVHFSLCGDWVVGRRHIAAFAVTGRGLFAGHVRLLHDLSWRIGAGKTGGKRFDAILFNGLDRWSIGWDLCGCDRTKNIQFLF